MKKPSFPLHELPNLIKTIRDDEVLEEGESGSEFLKQEIKRQNFTETKLKKAASKELKRLKSDKDEPSRSSVYRFKAGEQGIEGITYYAFCQALGIDWDEVGIPWDNGSKEPDYSYIASHNIDIQHLVYSTSQRGSSAVHDHQHLRHSASQKFWNVPYDENTFFTGREHILQDLRDILIEGNTVALTQIIRGLGGIGKTQVAVKYAYLFRHTYQAIFWVRSETETDIITSFVAIARCLALPLIDGQNPNDIVNAVKHWLDTHSDWLLIFDNADEPKLIKQFRPQRSGHILITSRAHNFGILGISKPVILKGMLPEKAVEFLFKRTDIESNNETELQAARQLAKTLDYFPLALEQAGAHIAEHQESFQSYLHVYQQRRLKLLEEQGPIAGDYPESVATTWVLNFDEVKKVPEAADILRASAFFNPEAIPYELLEKGSSELGKPLSDALAHHETNPLVINKLLTPLARYSLISRQSSERTYSINRMVQEVIKDQMDDTNRRLWAERTVKALALVFPHAEFQNWPQCERLLPQVRIGSTLIEKFKLRIPESIELLLFTGDFLHKTGKYNESNFFLKNSYDLSLQLKDHEMMAICLNRIGLIHQKQGNYTESERSYNKAINIIKKTQNNSDKLVTIINNLGVLYKEQKDFDKVENLFFKALEILKNSKGNETLIATFLNNIGSLYDDLRQYKKSEYYYLKSLEMRRDHLNPKHPDIAQSLHNLSSIYIHKGKIQEAISFQKEAIDIWEFSLGEDHSELALGWVQLGDIYMLQNNCLDTENYSEAENYFNKALKIQLKSFGYFHRETADTMSSLINLYIAQDRYKEAEEKSKKTLEIRQKIFNNDHPDVLSAMSNLGGIYIFQKKKYREAERLLKTAFTGQKKILSSDNPSIFNTIVRFMILYKEKDDHQNFSYFENEFNQFIVHHIISAESGLEKKFLSSLFS